MTNWEDYEYSSLKLKFKTVEGKQYKNMVVENDAGDVFAETGFYELYKKSENELLVSLMRELIDDGWNVGEIKPPQWPVSYVRLRKERHPQVLIEQLRNLHKAGILTDEEFEAKKQLIKWK